MNFKVKEGIETVMSKRFKGRLVARGLNQKQGVTLNDVFSLIVKYISIRILFVMVARFDLELEQMDVKTAFLYGDLDETILMKKPEGYEAKCRKWNGRFDKLMAHLGFRRRIFYHCVYFRLSPENSLAFLLLYVDDILIANTPFEEVMRLNVELNQEFEMNDLGIATRILGINTKRDRK